MLKNQHTNYDECLTKQRKKYIFDGFDLLTYNPRTRSKKRLKNVVRAPCIFDDFNLVIFFALT